MEDRWSVLVQGIFRKFVICLVLTIVYPVYEADVTVKVLGQTEPVVCLVGDVILLCALRSNISTVNAVQEAVEWQRPDKAQREVHFYTDSRDSNMDQNPSYRGRTSLFKEELKNGNVSLKLTSVKLSDAGNYSCSVSSLLRNQKAFVHLKVGAISQPVISIMGPKDDGVALKCESGGWYPEPKMIWLDSDGNILPDGPTETQTDSEGRYTLRGEVTIQKTDNNKFTCRVTQQQINKMKETRMNVPDDAFAKSRGGLIAGVITAVLVAVVAGSVGVFMWRKKTKVLNEKDQLKRENNKLKGGNDQLKRENNKLKVENDQLKRENNKLIGENDKLKQDMDKLKQDMDKLKQERGELKGEIDKPKGETDKLIGEIDKPKGETNKPKGETNKPKGETGSGWFSWFRR